ncbi:MAG: ATP12 family protein [Sphingobium sp.]
MKRFYKQAAATPADGGYGIMLDGRPVRTPARALLALPTVALADAIAQEWNAQGENIKPESMIFTGLANAAIDQILPDPAAFAAGVAVYGESDLLCYRAEAPPSLIDAQAESWNPLLGWARERYDVAFLIASGIIHVGQPPETIARMRAVVMAYDAFMLAGLSTLVTMSGSLIIGLAVIEGAISPDRAWQASEIDELWQAQQWGDDADAAARRDRRGVEFAQAAQFCALLKA